MCKAWFGLLAVRYGILAVGQGKLGKGTRDGQKMVTHADLHIKEEETIVLGGSLHSPSSLLPL